MPEVRRRLHVVDLPVPVVPRHEPPHWVPHHVEVADVAAQLSEVGKVEVSGVDYILRALTENIR